MRYPGAFGPLSWEVAAMDKPGRVILIGLAVYAVLMVLLVFLVLAWYVLYAFGFMPEPRW
jgi:hypothetical protein